MDQSKQKKLIIEDFSSDTLNKIFLEAINNRVSDIHIEPQTKSVSVRFRIDGLLRPVFNYDRLQMDELISRIKVLSGMDIAEHRLPGDGYLECTYKDRTYNI